MSADPVAASIHAGGRSGLVAWALERRFALAVWVSMSAWAALLFGAARHGYANFRYARFDLGDMVQAVWSTAHGRPLEVTSGLTGEQVSRLGGHVDPILALFAPLWLLWPSPLLLELAQIVALALGALPVFWLARRHLASERLACLFALAYLAYPWLSWVALESFHPVTLAIPLLLYCIWFLDSDRIVPFAGCALLTVMTGELMGLTVAVLGIWYAVARGRRWAGYATAALGAAWSVVALYLVVPSFSGGASVFFSYYGPIGGSPQGVLRTLVTDPGAIAGMLLDRHHVMYLVWLGVPLAGLFLLAPGLAAVALPQLLASDLSDFRSQTDPRFHYLAGAVPFLVAAAVLGVARLRESRRPLAITTVLVVSVALALFVGAWPRVVGKTPLGTEDPLPSRHVEALDRALQLVPAGAAVSTTNTAGSRLSARRYFYLAPTIGRATWIVADVRDPWVIDRRSPLLVYRPAAIRAFVRRIGRSADWRKQFEQDGVLVFRKTLAS